MSSILQERTNQWVNNHCRWVHHLFNAWFICCIECIHAGVYFTWLYKFIQELQVFLACFLTYFIICLPIPLLSKKFSIVQKPKISNQLSTALQVLERLSQRKSPLCQTFFKQPLPLILKHSTWTYYVAIYSVIPPHHKQPRVKVSHAGKELLKNHLAWKKKMCGA